MNCVLTHRDKVNSIIPALYSQVEWIRSQASSASGAGYSQGQFIDIELNLTSAIGFKAENCCKHLE